MFLYSFVIIIISICYTLITCVDTTSNDSILKMVYISISFCLVSFLFRLDWHISCNQCWSVPRLFRIVEHKSCSICRSSERERERERQKEEPGSCGIPIKGEYTRSNSSIVVFRFRVSIYTCKVEEKKEYKRRVSRSFEWLPSAAENSLETIYSIKNDA